MNVDAALAELDRAFGSITYKQQSYDYAAAVVQNWKTAGQRTAGASGVP